MPVSGSSTARSSRASTAEPSCSAPISGRTGGIVDADWLQYSFPVQWHYDILRGLDYFRSAGDTPDPRLAEAIEQVRARQQPGGRWLLENTHPGLMHFELEEGDRRPSRWNTLRARRVLRWYDAA